MILEIAEFDIIPGKEEAFEEGVKQALPLFKRAKGYRGIALRRIVEKPSTYRLFVQWETLEDHTVTFRNSDDFQQWRALVGIYFAGPSRVDHCSTVIDEI
ncbi:antibiotic biosynthesis monooxygenase family protein [Nitratireductor indicus]|uniref:antibiotic biosynthesis monooxygenase family protein n=1 Tax=Nitratireductor indicus TaxID=721133 RepID=UPI0028756D81|nr:antibiotic biosynthesis monooxygenase family protein [Nitratireductor indicus]MDS1135162.1 antibiotic biosynthesis monooxygenase family protein [Nitratireductor indicus]